MKCYLGKNKTKESYYQNRKICLIQNINEMKKYLFVLMTVVLGLSCSGQSKEAKKAESKEKAIMEQPKGTWKVNREFDEDGNLVRYDSIYSWSSSHNFDNFSNLEKDSALEAFKSKFFSSFSDFENQGFENIFSKDSIFSKRFFNEGFFESNFGKDFMDIDHLRKQMIERQKEFLEKYQSEFAKPEKEK